MESARKSDAKKRCQHCLRRFVHERSTARFCSKSCRQKAHYHHGKVRAEQAAAAAAEMARNEWHTPAVIIEAVQQVLGDIDLDPASCREANRIVQAKAIYTVADNGLTKPWAGRVFLNPPYGREAPKFALKFDAEYRSGAVTAACLLLAVHHMTTKWFAPLAVFQPMMCLPDHRLHFSGSTTRPTHGSVILGFGVDSDRFRKAFACFGPVSTFG